VDAEIQARLGIGIDEGGLDNLTKEGSGDAA
jgi:hypothetical protein